MESTTIEHLHKDVISIKKELEHIRVLLEENYEVADDVVTDLQESKSRSSDDMVSHKDMRKEFGE